MSAPTIAVVDYGMGNRRSVEKALVHCGARARITAAPTDLDVADGVVLPGVGSFPRGVELLRERGLEAPLRRAAQDGRPLLGICLGMQLLFDASEEHGGAAGLGLLSGQVTRLHAAGARLPHIGWNLVSWRRSSALTAGVEGAQAYYHVHSYACRPTDPEIIVGESHYSERFCSVVERGAISGTQFHPEKSSTAGLELLTSFVSTCAKLAA